MCDLVDMPPGHLLRFASIGTTDARALPRSNLAGHLDRLGLRAKYEAPGEPSQASQSGPGSQASRQRQAASS